MSVLEAIYKRCLLSVLEMPYGSPHIFFFHYTARPYCTRTPKIFLHQRLFHQFQLFKALLYGLLLLVYVLYKSGKIILKFF